MNVFVLTLKPDCVVKFFFWLVDCWINACSVCFPAPISWKWAWPQFWNVIERDIRMVCQCSLRIWSLITRARWEKKLHSWSETDYEWFWRCFKRMRNEVPGRQWRAQGDSVLFMEAANEDLKFKSKLMNNWRKENISV